MGPENFCSGTIPASRFRSSRRFVRRLRRSPVFFFFYTLQFSRPLTLTQKSHDTTRAGDLYNPGIESSGETALWCPSSGMNPSKGDMFPPDMFLETTPYLLHLSPRLSSGE